MNYDPNDLLSQISAQDEVVEDTPKKKKHRSISIDFAVLFMKLTFAFDEVKRKYNFLFSFLGWLWAVFMVLVYIGGLAMVGLLGYSYLTFPDKVHNALITQGIVTKGYEVENMSLSRIELKNLEDKDGTYSIKKMVIHSTFADFIRGRVKSVELDGVKVKVSETEKGLNLGKLPEALITLNQNPALHRIKVNNLQINNAELSVNGKNFVIPVSFHLTGIYSHESKITMTLFTRKDAVKMDGVLSITGTAQKMEFALKINNGTLELPGRTPENISGEINLSTQKMELTKVSGHLKLSYGKNLKELNVSMNSGKGGYAGNVSIGITQGNLNGQDVQSHLAVDFSELNFDSLYRFTTTKPLKVKMRSFKLPRFDLANLTATLNGTLTCDRLDCSYQVSSASPVFIKEINAVFEGEMIKSTEEFNFTLVPNKKTSLSYKNGEFNYDLKVQNVLFSGYRNMSSMPISLSASAAEVLGAYYTNGKPQHMKVSTQKMNISTPEIRLSNASFKRDDMFNESSKLSWTAEEAEILQNDVLKTPFKVSLEKTGAGLETKANVVIGDVVNVSFAGVSRLLTGEFNGNLYVKEFDLAKLKTPLSDMSSLFVNGMTNLSGKVALVGRIYFKNSKQIAGPMFVSLKDVGFSKGDTKVSGLNTVLSLQTLVPLVTAANQSIFISDISGTLPIQNVLADIKLDSQFLRVSSAQMALGGMTLTADSVILPLKANSSLLNFKNLAVNLADMVPYVNLSGAKVSGKGSMQVSLEVKDDKILIKDGEFKVLNADVSLKETDKALKSYFENASSYVIRSGNIFMDSEESNNMLNLSFSLDGRLQPSAKMKNVRKQLNQKPSDLIKPMPRMSVPKDIIRRQEIVAH